MSFEPRKPREGEEVFTLLGDDPLFPPFVDAYRAMIEGNIDLAIHHLRSMQAVIDPLPPHHEKVRSCADKAQSARERQRVLAVSRRAS